MKHTKGKWKVSWIKGDIDIAIGVESRTKVDHGIYSQIICNTILPDSDEQYLKEREEIEANAQLIAAAPLMLKALQEIVEKWNDSANPSGMWDHVIHAIAVGAINEATK